MTAFLGLCIVVCEQTKILYEKRKPHASTRQACKLLPNQNGTVLATVREKWIKLEFPAPGKVADLIARKALHHPQTAVGWLD